MTRILAALALMTTLVACNTISGVGQDVQAGGKAITRGAETVERKISN